MSNTTIFLKILYASKVIGGGTFFRKLGEFPCREYPLKIFGSVMDRYGGGARTFQGIDNTNLELHWFLFRRCCCTSPVFWQWRLSTRKRICLPRSPLSKNQWLWHIGKRGRLPFGIAWGSLELWKLGLKGQRPPFGERRDIDGAVFNVESSWDGKGRVISKQ